MTNENRLEKKAVKRAKARPPVLAGSLALSLTPSTSSPLPTSTITHVVPLAPVMEAEPKPMSYIDRGLPIPEGYGYDRLVALVRDTVTVFCYWELHNGKMLELRQQRGQSFIDACVWVLRLYNLNEDVAYDTEIDPSQGSTYANVGQPGRFQFEIGLLSPDGEWVSLLVSQVVETAYCDSTSEEVDDEWRLRPEDEAALKGLLRPSPEDANLRGTSRFLGASGFSAKTPLFNEIEMLGSSGFARSSGALGASGVSSVGSWAFSFLGASRVAGSGSGAGGFGWLVAPNGAHEPALDRPSLGIEKNKPGPNWNAQPNLPAMGTGKTAQPHFKVKLPRRLEAIKPPPATWPSVKVKKPLGRLVRAGK